MNDSDTVIPSVPEGDFSLDDWRELRDVLKVAEPVFRNVATESKLRLLSSARWPELRLQRRVGWTTAELRLSLHPDPLGVPLIESRWVVNLVRYPRFAWFPVGGSSVETIKVLSARDLRSVDLRRDIHGLINRLAPGGK